MSSTQRRCIPGATLAGALALGLVICGFLHAEAWGAAKKSPSKDKDKATATGVVASKRDDSVRVKLDGDDLPTTFHMPTNVLAGGSKTNLVSSLNRISVGDYVKVEYTGERHPELISIQPVTTSNNKTNAVSNAQRRKDEQARNRLRHERRALQAERAALARQKRQQQNAQDQVKKENK